MSDCSLFLFHQATASLLYLFPVSFLWNVPLPTASVLNKAERTDGQSGRTGCRLCECAEDAFTSEGGPEDSDGLGASWTGCSGDPPGSLSGPPTCHRIAPRKTKLVRSSSKTDHKCIFLFYGSCDNAVIQENSHSFVFIVNIVIKVSL